MALRIFGRSKPKEVTLSSDSAMPRMGLGARMLDLFTGRTRLDDSAWAELEDILIGADVGVETTLSLIDSLKSQGGRDGFRDRDQLRNAVLAAFRERLQEYTLDLQ